MTSPSPRTRADRNAHRVELAGQTVAGSVGSAFGAAKLRDAFKEEHPQKFTRALRRSVHSARARGVQPKTVARAVRVAHSGKPNFASLITLTAAGGTAATAHHYRQIHDWSRKRKEQVGDLVKSEPRRAPSPPIRLRVTPPPRHAPRPYTGAHRKLTLLDRGKQNMGAKAMLHSKKLVTLTEATGDFFKAFCPRCAPLVKGEARYAHAQGLGRVQVLGHHGGGEVHVLDRSDQARLVHQDKLRFDRSKKGTPMHKDAFGVEDITKMFTVAGIHSGGAKAMKAAEEAKRATALKHSRRVRAIGTAAGGATAGATATAGVTHLARRRQGDLAMAKSAFGVEHDELYKGEPVSRMARVADAAFQGADTVARTASRRRGTVGFAAGAATPAAVKRAHKGLKRRRPPNGGGMEEGVAKSAFGVGHDLEKAHVIRDALGLGAAAGAGALLAKPELAAGLGRGAKAVVTPVKNMMGKAPGLAKRPAPGLPVKRPGPGMVGKSAFFYEAEARDEIVKASAFGTKGDKRNTKYYLAAAAGSGAGGQAGARIGARAGGSTVRRVKQESHTDIAGSLERFGDRMSATPAGPGKHRPPTFRNLMSDQTRMQRGAMKAATKEVKSVPGGKALLRGGRVGAAVGAAGGAGAYAVHRRRKGMGGS